MQIRTVFKAGNSNVISIPKHLAKELGLKSGEKVVVEKEVGGEGLIVRKLSTKGAKKTKPDIEFKKWLDVFLKENSEILDELALR